MILVYISVYSPVEAKLKERRLMAEKMNNNLIQYRTYGDAGPILFLLHGGPGAPGYMSPVARHLAHDFRVIEPLQRRGDVNCPLTVAQHVADLHNLIASLSPDQPPILVGHSWGAMLSLIYAAQYPDAARSLTLIGCGTFDPVSRQKMKETRHHRMAAHKYKRMKQRMDSLADPDERLQILGKIMIQIDSYKLVHVKDEVLYFDGLGHEQTWHDMMGLMNNGTYPAAFQSITAPAMMLHGDHDPHPGPMIYDNLKVHIPHLNFHQWTQCGHYPWLEKHASKDFYTILNNWLIQEK